jgi:glycosyltransferase involved in cell wall biosynthesis
MAGVKSVSHIPVAVFLTRFEPGGTERQMTELIRRLDPSQFTVHVACFERAGAWLPRVAERATSIVEFPIRGLARPAAAVQMMTFARWCRRERIAVVQTCDLYANIFGLPAASLAGVPVRIGSRRDLNPDKSPAQIWAQRQAYRCATKVVANAAAARAMLEQEGLATESIAVIPNGMDVAAFPDRSRDRVGRPVRSVITVANLRREKSHETLVAAAAMLRPEFPDARFQIVGAGPRRAELEALVHARQLDGVMTFLGHREDVAGLLSEADAFVLPSRSEALPNSVIEAMAAGLPVIASDVGGLPDLIDGGRTGLLVEPGSPEALAAALRELFTDSKKAAALGDAARLHVRQRYSFDRMVKAFEDLYLAGLRARARSATNRAQAAGA